MIAEPRVAGRPSTFWKAGVSGLLALLAITAFAGHVTAQTASRVTINGVTVSDSQVTASVTVADSQGKPVSGLTDSSFTVAIDGRPVTDATVDSNVDTALPLGMVLVMDISNTMSPASISGAKDAFGNLIRSLRATDEAQLVTISTQVTQVVQPTSDQSALLAGINGVTPGGRTALYAAVVKAVDYAKAAPQPRKVIVLVTEGGGRVGEEFGGASGNISRTMALNAAATGGAPLFVVGIGKEADVAFLGALATNSGGQYISASNGAEVSQLYSTMSDRLRLQYNLTMPLPVGLDAGDHKVTITANGATGEAPFKTTVAIAAPPPPALTGLADELTQPGVVKAVNLPIGADVRWLLDGQPVTATGTSDRRSISLDPYKLDPSKPHTLRAQYDGADASKGVEASFKVAAMPPKLLQPTSLPGLRAGDFVRVELQSQADVPTSVTYIVDGKAMETDTDRPYEFTLPKDGVTDGQHQFAISVDSGGQKVAQSFDFAGPKPLSSGGNNSMVYILIAVFALAALGAAGYGGKVLMERAAARKGAVVITDAPERLLQWADAHRGDRVRPEAPAAPAPATATGPWGTMEMLEGEGTGTRFELNEDRELVGRGKFCSVRLADKTIEEAHFLVTQDGMAFASTPNCRILIDGAEVRGGKLTDGSVIRLGGTVLKYHEGPGNRAVRAAG